MATVDFASGVYLFEKNLSTRPRAQANDTVGMVGRFRKGRVGERILITSPRNKTLLLGPNNLEVGRYGNVLDDLLTETSRVYVARVARESKYAGLVCRKSESSRIPTPVITVSPGAGAGMGILTNGTYSYRVSAYDLHGETVASLNATASVVTSPTTASLTTSLTGTHNDITYRSVAAGVIGNSHTVEYVDPAANNSPLTVTLTVAAGAMALVVSLATNGSGTIVTTANDIMVALAAQGTAFTNYMTAELATSNDGSGVVTALAEANLSGGAATGSNDGYVNISWTSLQSRGATGYRIYGRTAGSELFIADVAGGAVTSYRDTGTVTPAGALPGTNTTNDLALLPWTIGEDDPANEYIFQTTDLFIIYADNQGAWANTDLRVAITKVSTATNSFEISVYDQSNTPVERYFVARQRQLDGYGVQQFIEDRINVFSNRIKVRNNPLNTDAVAKAFPQPVSLAGGDDGVTPLDSDFINALQLFADPDQVRVRQLVNAGYTSLPFQQAMVGIAEARKDCVVRLDAPVFAQTSVTNMLTWRNVDANWNTSFATVQCSDKRAYDRENSTEVFVPMSGEEAAAFVRVSRAEAPWFAAAGRENGKLTFNFLGTRRQSNGSTMPSNQGERIALAEAHINYIITRPGAGSWIGEQFTLTSEPSLLENANVRFLLINVQQAIAEFLEYYTFQPGDEILRRQISVKVQAYLERVQGLRGIRAGFEVICDESNNSAEDQDAGIVNLEVALTPIAPGRRIAFTTIITPTGFSFSDLT